MNDRDSYEGAYAYSILDSAVRFDNKWYDKSLQEINRIIEMCSNNNFVYVKFSYKELGKTERWFKKQCRELNNDLAKIKRELLLEWTLANDRSPFSEEQLDKVSQYILDKPIDCLYLKGCYKFDIYEKLDNIVNTNWIVGVDIGGGLMQDYTVITIIDPATKKLKALFRSNSILSDELIGLIEFMLQTFFPKAVIVPERNSLGITIIDAMVKNPTIRPRLYYEVKDRIAERKVTRLNVSEMTKVKTKVEVFGQVTDKNSREVMFRNILPYMIDEEPENIICKELFDEIKTLERGNTGKIAARSGAHDDVVMAYLIGLYALLYGKNINKFVKILPAEFHPEKGEVMSVAEGKYRRFMNEVLKNNEMPPELLKLYNQGKEARLKESLSENSDLSEESKKVLKGISWLLKK